jgi:peptide/nickel transport system substrate-binding protein
LSIKLWLSGAIATAGAGMLLAAGLAHPSDASRTAGSAGGTLVYDTQGDFRSMDPQISNFSLDWSVMQATCLKLLNWPDTGGPRASQLQPEAATGFPVVSNGGKTYDFTVNAPWTKFSNGQPVTARSFKNAFERMGDPRLASPGVDFFTEVVGLQDKRDGKATNVRGVQVKGKHLIIRLSKPAPDFLARMGLMYTCAVPDGLPNDPAGVTEPPAAGPYYVADWTRGRSLTMKRNPYYKGKRPHALDGINWVIGNAPEATQLRLESGQADVGSVPSSSWGVLAQKYGGVNKGRVYAENGIQTWFLALNHDRPLFKNGGKHGNVNLGKAINFALDRHALVIQRGAFSGTRTDQLLPPNMPGFRDADIYPTIKPPNLKLAKRFAAGHTGTGKVVLYAFAEAYGPLWAQTVQFNLAQIGLDVTIQTFPINVLLDKLSTRGEPYDIAITNWGADYADPFDFLNILLYGPAISDTRNHNHAYFNDPTYNKKLLAASMLTGPKRFTTYGDLDIDLMRNAAPVAPMMNSRARFFVSARTGCWSFHNVLGVPNLAALCLK